MGNLDMVISTLEKNPNPEKRRNAADVLLKLGSENPAILIRTVPALVKALGDEDEGVRRRAAFALYKVSVANPEIIVKYINYLIKFFVAGISGKVRVSSYGAYSSIANIFGVIGERHPDLVAPVVPYLIAAINYPVYHPENPHSDLDKLYSSVLRALGRIGGKNPELVKNGISYIVRCLTDSFKYKAFRKENPNDKTSLRWSALFAVDSIAHAAPNMVVPYLVKLLTDTSREIKEMARAELWRLAEKPTRVIPALVHTMGDEKPGIREEATKFMVELGLKEPKYAIPALITCFQSKNAFIRMNAAYALGEIGKKKPELVKSAIPALLASLSDENKDVRQHAADALFKIAEVNLGFIASGAKEITKALRDPYHHVRWRAVMLIGMLGEKNKLLAKDAVPILAHMFNDPQDHVRWRAEEALKLIGVDKSEYLQAEKGMEIVAKLLEDGKEKGIPMPGTQQLFENARDLMDRMEYRTVIELTDKAKETALKEMEGWKAFGKTPEPEIKPTSMTTESAPIVEEKPVSTVNTVGTPAENTVPKSSVKTNSEDVEIIYCPYCGAENYSNFNFCIKCRKPLPKNLAKEENKKDSAMEEKYRIYREALEVALKDGKIGSDEREMLEKLRETLGLTEEDHIRLEREVLQKMNTR